MRLYGMILAGTLTGATLFVPRETRAEDADTAALIRQLQHRIDELEQKVKALEQGQGAHEPATATTNRSKADEHPEALDGKRTASDHPQELETGAAEARTQAAPRLTLGEQGFEVASSNGNFAVRLAGVLQVDSRTFLSDSGAAGNDGFLLRRARPILSGTVFRDFDFYFLPEFGTGANGGNGGTASTPQIYDAYLNYRYSPALQLQVGKFKSPVGLEQLQPDRDAAFNERALPTDLVPVRELGFELHGDLFDGAASYAVGAFSGVGDARLSSNSDFDNDKAFEGRVFFQPFKKTSLRPLEGLGFGLGGSYQGIHGTNTAGLPNTTGGSLPGYATVGQQQFFAYNPANKAAVVADGDHYRISPQGYYYYGPFGLMGEYVISDQKVTRTGPGIQPKAYLSNTAWEITASWVLTGEDASFGQIIPRHSFDPARGHWGAWQLAARYSELSLDPAAFPLFADPATSTHAAHEWSAGINWYLNSNVRVNLSYSQTLFGGGGASGSSSPANVTRQPENVFFTRVQLAF